MTYPPFPHSAGAAPRRRRAWLTRFMPEPAAARASSPRWRAAIAPVLTLAVAIGYVGVDVTGSIDDPVLSPVPPLAHAGLVALQALALVWQRRFPAVVLLIVAAADAAILATSGGQLGIGSLAVVIGAYAVRRAYPLRAAMLPLVTAAALTSVVGTVALILAPVPPFTIIVAFVSRLLILYIVPVGAAEYLDSREQLVRAQQEKHALLERERRVAAERALREERTALARELHDVAGHHLSGIIVTAQAAAALSATDPGRTRELLGSIQTDARTALSDLRRTVGLLRSDDAAGPQEPPARPSLPAIRDLVAAARASGRHVALKMPDDLPVLTTLADVAAYRMVQESLANIARHADGAPATVRVQTHADALHIVVENDAPAARRAGASTVQSRGYGLAGMQERAELIGARLTASATADGGWRNELVIPLPPGKEDT